MSAVTDNVRVDNSFSATVCCVTVRRARLCECEPRGASCATWFTFGDFDPLL
jgi:hypothetical protein